MVSSSYCPTLIEDAIDLKSAEPVNHNAPRDWLSEGSRRIIGFLEFL